MKERCNGSNQDLGTRRLPTLLIDVEPQPKYRRDIFHFFVLSLLVRPFRFPYHSISFSLFPRMLSFMSSYVSATCNRCLNKEATEVGEGRNRIIYVSIRIWIVGEKSVASSNREKRRFVFSVQSILTSTHRLALIDYSHTSKLGVTAAPV